MTYIIEFSDGNAIRCRSIEDVFDEVTRIQWDDLNPFPLVKTIGGEIIGMLMNKKEIRRKGAVVFQKGE